MLTEIPRTVLVVAAHPDDAEFGCGGTIANWIAAGSKAYYLIATNGDKGDDTGNYSPEELAKVRQAEQKLAADKLGISDMTMLSRSDGSLEYNVNLRGDVVRWIRTWKPDAVFTHDPTVLFFSRGGVNHADHRAIGQATVDAVYPFARGLHQYPEQIAAGLEPHKVRYLLLWDSNTPNFTVNVSDTAEKKLEALLTHASQFPQTDSMRNYTLEHMKSMAEGTTMIYAESFFVTEFGA